MKSLIDSLQLNSEALSGEFLGNALGEYVLAAIALVGIVLVLKLFQVIVIARLKSLAKKTKTEIDDMLVEMIKTIRPPLYLFVSLYISLRLLAVNEFVQRAFDVVLIIWLVYQAVIMAQLVVDYILNRSTKNVAKENKNAIKFLGNIFKFILWVVGALIVVQNLGFNVSALVAGVGIGGIAIALALQSILGDLFSSFSIVFDKPFVVGDSIKVGGKGGTVEKIGIKTTRIRSPEGEEVIMSNTELTNAQIQNFGRLKERRVTLKFGVLYETPKEKLEKIPSIVKGIIDGVDSTRFHRAHFVNFGDSALEFQVTYHILSDDYNLYLDKQQETNFALKREFEERGIGMAYPTQTVYLNK